MHRRNSGSPVMGKTEKETGGNRRFNRACDRRFILFRFHSPGAGLFSPELNTGALGIGILYIANRVFGFMEYNKNKKSLFYIGCSGHVYYGNNSRYLAC